MKNKNPTCSHCGYVFDDDETWHSSMSETGTVHTGDCDTSELVCPNLDCKKTFYVACSHDVFFTQIDKDGDDI